VQDALAREGSDAGRIDTDQLDDLASQVSRGVRPAFEQIYFLLIDDLYAYARSHTSDDSSAEDVVATVFLKAWQYGRRYRGGTGSYRRWIFGIARNEVRNFWRAERKSQVLERELETLAVETPAAPEPMVDEAALRCALERLTEEQRDVVTLRYFGGKTHREIAEILGKGEGSIRALQHRALRQMRKVVANAAP
jgi:RNA polymerase sigma-70 factor (ECF subfamily)